MEDNIPKATAYRPRCYFDISINHVPAGRVIFELFADICPITCDNFRALCTGEKGEGKTTLKPLHFKGTVFHRIVKEFMVQGGDFSAGNGSGGESIYGGSFEDENFTILHDRPFLLSMANRGPNTNGSQFFITLKETPHLDKVHVVFGHVISGQDVIRVIENQKVDSQSKPYADLRITNCGELIKKAKAVKAPSKKKAKKARADTSDSEKSSSDASTESEAESSSDSDEDVKKRAKRSKKDKKKKRKSAKKKKKKKKEKKSTSASASREQEPQPLAVDPISIDDIPDVPTNSFLMRRSKTPSPVRELRELNREKNSNAAGYKAKDIPNIRNGEDMGEKVIERVSRSGRKLRGRGTMRYRTPPKSPDETENYRHHRRSRSPPRYRHERRRSRDRRSPRIRSRSPLHRRRSRSPRRRRSPSPTHKSHSERNHEKSLSPFDKRQKINGDGKTNKAAVLSSMRQATLASKNTDEPDEFSTGVQGLAFHDTDHISVLPTSPHPMPQTPPQDNQASLETDTTVVECKASLKTTNNDDSLPEINNGVTNVKDSTANNECQDHGSLPKDPYRSTEHSIKENVTEKSPKVEPKVEEASEVVTEGEKQDQISIQEDQIAEVPMEIESEDDTGKEEVEDINLKTSILENSVPKVEEKIKTRKDDNGDKIFTPPNKAVYYKIQSTTVNLQDETQKTNTINSKHITAQPMTVEYVEQSQIEIAESKAMQSQIDHKMTEKSELIDSTEDQVSCDNLKSQTLSNPSMENPSAPRIESTSDSNRASPTKEEIVTSNVTVNKPSSPEDNLSQNQPLKGKSHSSASEDETSRRKQQRKSRSRSHSNEHRSIHKRDSIRKRRSPSSSDSDRHKSKRSVQERDSSRSKSRSPRKRSSSYNRKSSSSYSKYKRRSSRSSSRDRHRSRSKSRERKRRSRSRSVSPRVRRRKSRSYSRERRHRLRSRSRSKDRRHRSRSRSRSRDRRRRSRSKSRERSRKTRRSYSRRYASRERHHRRSRSRSRNHRRRSSSRSSSRSPIRKRRHSSHSKSSSSSDSD